MASGTYTAATLDQACAAVAARLDDPGQIHWTPPELQRYVQEALRIWGALTAAFRSTLTFNTNLFGANAPFYDLPTLSPALRGQTVTDLQALQLLEYHLLEPASTGSAWSGSSQFGLSDLISAIQNRRDQFLIDTSAVVTRTLDPISPPPDGRIPLPESVVTLRRVAWVDPAGTVTPLQRDDEWGANSYLPSWVQTPTQRPRIYSVGVTQPLYTQLIPPPFDTGQLDLIVVPRGAVLGTALNAGGTSLGIPNDWVWVVIFGALADLFSKDGLSLDPARAAYCQTRWDQGISLAQAASVVLTGRIDNVVCRVATVQDADSFNRNWQTTPGTPRTLLTCGQTLLAVLPPPTVNAPSGWGVTLDVVQNTPVPISGPGYLPVGPEHLDTLYDYAQHLALLKEGPAQLQTSMALAVRFFTATGAQAAWLRALTPSRAALLGQTVQDRRGAAPAHVAPLSEVSSEGA